MSDFSITFTLLFSSFSKTFFSLNSYSVSSVLNFIVLNDLLKSSSSYLNYFYLDFLVEISSVNSTLTYIIKGLGSDYYLSFFASNPETVFMLNSYFTIFNLYTIEYVSNFYDSFLYTVNSNLLDFFNFNLWLVVTLVFMLLLLNLLTYTRFSKGVFANFLLVKVYIFLNNFSLENRLQLDWSITFLIFILFVWVPLLMTYDDINVEVVELTHLFIILFFALTVLTLL